MTQKYNSIPLPKEVDRIPRRCRLDCLTPAELAIYQVIQTVEEVGTHPLLTDIVVCLGQIKEKLANYLEQNEETSTANAKHREQIADLILKDERNRNRVILSSLTTTSDGAMRFVVGENAEDGDRYQVLIKIEEI